MKIDLRVRDLKSGEAHNKTFASVEEARAFLEKRPPFAHVLGIASHNVPPEVNDELKAVMRPLDDDEKKAERALDEVFAAAQQKRAEEQRKASLVEAERHKKEMATADPNRPMAIRYTYNAGLTMTDAADPREITEDARAATMAWVEERNGWVEGRGQVVGDANLQVYPGELPEGKTERIVSGTFIPVTAPAKN